MGSILFAFLWVLITIAFITTLVITIVKIANKSRFTGVLVSTIALFFIGLVCFVGIFLALPSNNSYSFNQLFGDTEKTTASEDVTNLSDTPKKGLKGLKLGDKIKVGGVEVTVTKAEFVQPDDGYSYAENGKVLKVYYKFKNLGDDQVLVDSSDFTLTIDGETQEQFFGMNDDNAGFQHQLNKGNTGNSYLYYDVSDVDEYKVEMNFMPLFETYHADWIISRSEIDEVTGNQNAVDTEEIPTEEVEEVNKETDSDADDELKKLEAEEKKRQEEEDKKLKEEEKKQDEEDKKIEEEQKRQDAEDQAEEEAYEKELAEEERKEAEEEKKLEQEQQAQEEQWEKEQAEEEQRLQEEEEQYQKEMDEMDSSEDL